MRSKRRGVLTFEWILVLTLLVIGIVGGLAAVRDAQIIELASVAEGIISLNSSYSIQVPVKPELVAWGMRRNVSGVWMDLPVERPYPASAASGSNYEDTYARTNDDNVQVTVANEVVLPEDFPEGKEEVKATVFTEAAGNAQGAAPVPAAGFSGRAAVAGAAEAPSASAGSATSLSPATPITSGGSNSGGSNSGAMSSPTSSKPAYVSNGQALAAVSASAGVPDRDGGSAGSSGSSGSASSVGVKTEALPLTPPVDESEIVSKTPETLRPAAPATVEQTLAEAEVEAEPLPQADLRPVRPKRGGKPAVRIEAPADVAEEALLAEAAAARSGEIRSAVANPEARDTRSVRAPVADPEVRQAAAFEMAHSGKAVPDGASARDWTRLAPLTGPAASQSAD